MDISSKPGPVTRLPLELIHLIFRHVKQLDDVKNIRLVCQVWREVAASVLFRAVRLTPEQTSIEAFCAIGDSPTLAQHARRITIQTMSDLEHVRRQCGDRCPCEDKLMPSAGFIRHFARLEFQFPMADEINIKFASEDLGHSDDTDAVQTQAVRQLQLGFLLEFIDRRNKIAAISPGQIPITKLTCTNLLKFCEAGLQQTLPPVLASAKEFHASARVARVARSVQIPDLHHSQSELQRKWLSHMAPGLKSLSLYMDTYWGAIPFLDLASTHLPLLTELKLGNYCFLYPSQIAWIASLHSLELLSLDDCPIVALMNDGLELQRSHQMIKSGYWQCHAYGDGKYFYTNNAKWADYFDMIGRGLPRLRQFRCGHGDWEQGASAPLARFDAFVSDRDMKQRRSRLIGIQGTAFESRNGLGSKIHSTRYVVYAGPHAMHLRGAWFEVHMDHPEGNEMPKRAQMWLMARLNDHTRIPELSHNDRLRDEEALEKLGAIIQKRNKVFAFETSQY